jgi:ribosome biogenesis GTPase / thiamine phosphate phosphatase
MTTSTDATGIRARIVESFGRRVVVEIAGGACTPAELFGRRLACVCGDEVLVRPAANASQDHARVIAVGPRRSLLARTDSRGRTEAMAANLSLLAVLIAPEPAPDPFIVDRYLAGAALAGIEGMVIVNKTDRPTAGTAFDGLVDEYRQAGYATLAVSALGNRGIEALRAALVGRVTMFVGQSGVGKSTLTNVLAPASVRLTRSLSDATGEGRHTTVSTALYRIPTGGELIDSPGVRDYAPPLVEDAQVQVGWPEILARAPQCRFNNCLHLREPGCAVAGALSTGEIGERRYESYKRLVNTMRQLAPEYERRGR